jgi:hypothetical protein
MSASAGIGCCPILLWSGLVVRLVPLVPARERRADVHDAGVWGRSAWPRACPRAITGRRARREAAVYILDVQIEVAGRTSVEAVLGQMQLRRAALHRVRSVRRRRPEAIGFPT